LMTAPLLCFFGIPRPRPRSSLFPYTTLFRSAHIHLVAVAVILAGVLQVTWSLWSLRSTSWWVRPLRETRDAIVPMRRMLQQAWPMFIGLGVLQVNTFIDGLIASYGTTFGPTIFGYD